MTFERWGLPIGLAALAVAAIVLLWPVLPLAGQRLPGLDTRGLYALETYTRESLARGVLPHWNPFHYAGIPHLADTQTTVLYPVSLLMRWLPIVPFFGWMAAIHVWLMGAGMVALARAIGLSWLTSLTAAIAVMYGGAVAPTLYNGHLLVLYGTAWLPLTLALSIVSVRSDTAWPHPALPIALAMQFLAGYAQGTLYVAGAVAAYFVFSSIWPDPSQKQRARPLMQLAILVALTFGLSAFQLLPTLTLFSEAGRSAGVEYRFSAEGAWSFRDLATVFAPFVRTTESEPLRELPARSAYVGFLLPALAFIAPTDRGRRRMVVYFALLTVFGLALAMGDLPLYRLHHALFPGLRVPGRMLFVSCVGVAVLGAIGLERLAAWIRWPRVVMLAALVCVAIDLRMFAAGAANPVGLPPRERALDLIPPTTGRVLSLCENRVGPIELLTDRRPTLDGVGGVFLARYNDWAYLIRTGQKEPGDGTYHRVSDSEGYPARPDLLNLTAVSVVLSCSELRRSELRLVGEAGGVLVYENLHSRPRAFWSCGADAVPGFESPIVGIKPCATDAPVAVSDLDTPEGAVRASVDAPAAGLVFFSEPYYRERRVWVDGQPATPHLANLSFIGVAVGPGAHTIVLQYVPRRFHVGLVVTALALIVWVKRYAYRT